MAQVRIGRREAERWVLLRDASDPFRDGYDFVDFVTEVHGPGLEASSFVRSVEGSQGLAAFVWSLAADWRGWEGVRTWEAIEHDLTLEARHDPLGHVALRATLRHSWKPDAWQATVEIAVEAGEELRRLAEEVTEFLALPTSA